MTKAKIISAAVQDEIAGILADYNEGKTTQFQMSYDGAYAYLSKVKTEFEPDSFLDMFRKGGDSGNSDQAFSSTKTKIGRLEFNGDMDSWSFAVYSSADEDYNTDEPTMAWADNLDGTIEGALRAGEEL